MGESVLKMDEELETEEIEEKTDYSILTPYIIFIVGLLILLLLWHFYGKIETGDVFD